MRTREFNEEVLFATDAIVRIDTKDVQELKLKARSNKRRRARICAHKGHDDSIHEMLIVHENGCYVHPHMHIDKTESFHIVEGVVDIVLFDDDGQFSGIIPMGDYGSGRNFFYRLPATLYHTLLIQSESVVFHEITNGPFSPSDTVWAPWAPEETDVTSVDRYLEMVANYVGENG